MVKCQLELPTMISGLARVDLGSVVSRTVV